MSAKHWAVSLLAIHRTYDLANRQVNNDVRQTVFVVTADSLAEAELLARSIGCKLYPQALQHTIEVCSVDNIVTLETAAITGPGKGYYCASTNAP